MLKKNYLMANNLSSLVDSAENGHLTFHTDIDVMSEALQQQLGVDQIPAGDYPAIVLGDTAIYIQFSTRM